MPSLPVLPSFLASPLPVPPRSPRKPKAKMGRPKGSKSKAKPAPKSGPKDSSQAGQDEPAGSPQASPSSLSVESSQTSQSAPAAVSTDPLHSSSATPTGGEGVNQAQAAEYLDNTPPIGQILQSSAVAAGTAAVGAEGRSVLDLASPSGELEGFLQKGQGGSGEWPEIQVGTVCGFGRNKHYVSVEVGEGLVARLAVAGMRLTMNERVGVKRVWVSGDGRDAEYELVRRFEQPADNQPVVAEPVGFEGQVMPKPDREVIEPVADSDLVAGLGSESGSDSVVVPVESETEPAEDFIEKARRQAYEAYARG